MCIESMRDLQTMSLQHTSKVSIRQLDNLSSCCYDMSCCLKITIRSRAEIEKMPQRLRYNCFLLFLVGILILCLGGLAILDPFHWAPRIGSWLTAPGSASSGDALIVLGGNTIKRTELAVDLYAQGVASYLVITGHNPEEPNPYSREAEQAKKLAIEKGIPETAITLLDTASTYEDASAIAAYVQSKGWNHIIIVSDWTHGRRSMCTLKHVGAASPVRFVFRGRSDEFAVDNWWQSDEGVASVFSEIIKLFYYQFVVRMPIYGCWEGDLALSRLLLTWAAALFLSTLVVIMVRYYALRFRLLDSPNERSSHNIPTPVGGGVGIVSVTLGLFLIAIVAGIDIPLTRAFVYLLAGGVIAVIGLVDDWSRALSARTRLVTQFIVMLTFVAITGAFEAVYISYIGNVDVGSLIGTIITLVWLVGLVNAFNFMDGIDGLAGSQAFLAGSAWVVILLLEGQATLALLAGLIAVSSLGFLFLNAPPARIFMGDVGSTFLGFSFAALPVLAYTATGSPRLMITGVLFVGVFVFDAALTVIRRAMNKENIFRPHRSHLYQRLVTLGYSHRAVLVLYAYLMLLSILAGLAYYGGSSPIALGAVGAVLVMYACLALGVTLVEAPHRE